MGRREFLERMLAAGLVAASPKLIFDLAPARRTAMSALFEMPFGLPNWKWHGSPYGVQVVEVMMHGLPPSNTAVYPVRVPRLLNVDPVKEGIIYEKKSL